jgi:3-hydroxybutyryl-CoA dehydrogenase
VERLAMDAKDVKRVAVVGAGTMGHGIAQVFAQAGMEVGLVDVKEEVLQRALHLAGSNLRTLADSAMVSRDEVPAILGRIHPTTNLSEAASDVDFAIEAVSEVPSLKTEIFRQLDESCPAEAILASNTSTLDVFSIAEVRDPTRLVVAHWFAPPHIIPLVEVVPGPGTSPQTTTSTASLMERIGKRPVVLRQFVPSFIVNRIQNAIVDVVLEMLTNGWATPEEIDLAVKTSLGIRLPIVGVAQSLDFTGLKLIHDIHRAAGRASPFIDEKVSQGHLGASTSRGLYDYGGRSEEEILRKRDSQYLRMLQHLERIAAFEPV